MPDTGAYLLLGLAAVTFLMGTLIGSMVLRRINLERDLKLIQQLAEEEN